MAELRGGMRRGGWSGFGILEGIRKWDVSGNGMYLEKGRIWKRDASGKGTRRPGKCSLQNALSLCEPRSGTKAR